MQVTTIGLDLAKHVFQIHGIDAAEKVETVETVDRKTRDVPREQRACFCFGTDQ
jgi:hypothetical protein